MDGDGEPAAEGRAQAMNVQLSLEETYGDVRPVREAGARAAFLSIQRGCSNLCSFCIVPFVRGRERSRSMDSIVDEVKALSGAGVKEVTLLGQNVNSYSYRSPGSGGGGLSPAPRRPDDDDPFGVYAAGFESVYKPRRHGAANFAELLHRVASVDPELRVRYTSPHPKDFSDDVLDAVQLHRNVAKQMHLPAQSGSSSMLTRMGRGYTREAYLALVERIKGRMPRLALSSDFIAGFCGETEAEQAATVSLLEHVGYEQAFIFAYSKRAKTRAARHLVDDVPGPLKQERLAELLAVFRHHQARKLHAEVGRVHVVLVEGAARKSTPQRPQLAGRTYSGLRVVLEDAPAPAEYDGPLDCEGTPTAHVRLRAGDYVAVAIRGVSHATLLGATLGRTTLAAFAAHHGGSTVPAYRWYDVDEREARREVPMGLRSEG